MNHWKTPSKPKVIPSDLTPDSCNYRHRFAAASPYPPIITIGPVKLIGKPNPSANNK
ncbi:hypothetical protein Hanom_Chr12g01097421 [Helianthus anomalus]